MAIFGPVLSRKTSLLGSHRPVLGRFQRGPYLLPDRAPSRQLSPSVAIWKRASGVVRRHISGKGGRQLHPARALYSAGYDDHKHGCGRSPSAAQIRNARAPGPQGGAIP